MNLKQKYVLRCDELDALVMETYGKPYDFQQQDGCKDRGTAHFTIPVEHPEDFELETIREEVNGGEMGVSFKTWLARDPKEKLKNEEDGPEDEWTIELFWHRNFYPHPEILLNDLHNRGILPAGEYVIEIDW